MLNHITTKKITILFLLIGSLFAKAEHEHHTKHNMLLFGTDEIFADHIVYKIPHHYQVVLKVMFDPEAKQAYLNAKEKYPNDTFIFLLDTMNIGKIGEATKLSGTLLRRYPGGQEELLKNKITLEKGQFQLLYFQELPLSLQGEMVGHKSMTLKSGPPHKCDLWVCEIKNGIRVCKCND